MGWSGTSWTLSLTSMSAAPGSQASILASFTPEKLADRRQVAAQLEGQVPQLLPAAPGPSPTGSRWPPHLDSHCRKRTTQRVDSQP